MQTERPRLDEAVESRVLTSLADAIQLLDEVDAPSTGEGDVARLVDELESRRRVPWSVVDHRGFDCRVESIPPAARGTVRVDDCPVCGVTSAEPRFSIAGLPYRVVVCDDCGLGRLHPAPSASAVASFYPAEYYGTSGAKFRPAVEAMVRMVGARHVRSLAKGLPRGARVLDVGCGRGVLLSALADRGFEAHGFEVSETAAEGADPRARIRIADDLRYAGYPDAYFDEVILWHVLEHLSDPRGTLEEIRRILKPGGRLVVSVPNFSSLQARWAGPAWFHLDLPRHLFHFPLSALRRLVADCGFEARSEHHFSLRQNPFGWVQSWLNRNRRLPRNGLYRMLKNGGGNGRLFDRAASRRQWVAYYLGMPAALALSVFEAAFRQGASVCITARAPANGRRDRID